MPSDDGLSGLLWNDPTISKAAPIAVETPPEIKRMLADRLRLSSRSVFESNEDGQGFWEQRRKVRILTPIRVMKRDAVLSLMVTAR